MSENPYQPIDVQSTRHNRWMVVGDGAMALGGALLVVGNYVTATSGVWYLQTTFIHVLFILSPLAWIIHSHRLMAPKMHPASWPVLVLSAVLLVAYGISWLSSLSSNPYEQFVAYNFLTGSGPWVWLVGSAILPCLAFWKIWPVVQRVISLLAILVHLHVAYAVWQMCHMKWVLVT